MVETALAAFAHEVRTPLTGILAISNLLATSDLGERERRWVDTIKAGAEHLASLATLFVDAARSDGPGLEIRRDLFDLRALARNAGDSLAGRAAAKGLQAAVEVSDKLPGLAVGDPVRLRAALENLIDNAVKFTEQGARRARMSRPATRGQRQGRQGKGSASPSRCPTAASACRWPRSNGCSGRSRRPTSRSPRGFGGAGLGLSSVKQLARAMGGDIAVAAARRGGGTTFTLTRAAGAGGRARRPHRRAMRCGDAVARRCACSASRTIRSAASCSTPS